MAPTKKDGSYQHVTAETAPPPLPSLLAEFRSCLRINSPLSKLLVVVLYYIVGSLWFCNVENFTVLQSVYFATVTFTSVGYGFFHPSDDWRSQLFTIFFVLVGCTVIMSIFNDFARFYLVGAQEFFIRQYISARKIDADSVTSTQMGAYKVNFSLCLIVTALISGTLFFYGSEPDWSFVASVYWVVCTMTTVGFGDLTITRDETRIFNIFFIVATVLCYSLLVSNVLDQWVEAVTNRLRDEAEGDEGEVEAEGGRLSLTEVNDRNLHAALHSTNVGASAGEVRPAAKAFDRWVDSVVNADAEKGRAEEPLVSYDKIVLEVLLHSGRLNRERDLLPLLKRLQQLDTNGRGSLTSAELRDFATSLQAQRDPATISPLHSQ